MNNARFEWDPKKAADNRRKHGISFEEAETVVRGTAAFFSDDVEHSDTENRVRVIGPSERLRLLVVIIVEVDDDVIRIVSARRATKRESQQYEEAAHES